jgi:polyisoprenoid-binding protein YceI
MSAAQLGEETITVYTIDPVVSRITVRGFVGGILAGFGHNPIVGIRDVTGEARIDPQALELSSLTMRIRAASLEVQNNASEKDRREVKRVMDAEVLETAQYPDITFETTSVATKGNDTGSFQAELEGKLTLHGVTRALRVPVQVAVSGDMLRAHGEFTLNQTDYRIRPPSVAAGTVKLKDELKFTFDVVARQKSA